MEQNYQNQTNHFLQVKVVETLKRSSFSHIKTIKKVLVDLLLFSALIFKFQIIFQENSPAFFQLYELRKQQNSFDNYILSMNGTISQNIFFLEVNSKVYQFQKVQYFLKKNNESYNYKKSLPN